MTRDETTSGAVDEERRRRFERVRRAEGPVALADHLPPEDDPRYLPTLEELVHIDLELGWRRRPSDASATEDLTRPLVESYLANFPGLRAPPIVERLIAQESLVRHRAGGAPTSEEYRQRFPDADLSGITQATRGERPAALEAQRIPRIGHYRILRVIGEGGMGVVYLAEQERPQRRVALKIIRPGFATEAMLRRFEHEAQILGRLRHPGIAQVYEAGFHEDDFGRTPFIAMEYVTGLQLGDYAASRDVAPRAWVVLMAEICDAVQFAHQQGVIHRDLKPGNILIDDATGAPQPKILDFGVARVTDSDVRATLQTATGQLVGTLQYMSPEQASGDPAELDTRSDVYSLGVILYEMLAGAPPYDLGGRPISDAVRTIRDEDPPSLGRIDARCRGDLDVICAKAMEKQKARRYQTAAELGGDLRRHLHNEPIVAHPPSAMYQLRKFARRNRALVAGAAMAVAALIIGTAVAIFQAVEADRARKEAEGQRDEAQLQAKITEEINFFLDRELLMSVAPEERGIDVTVREVLDAASERIEGRFVAAPRVEASLRMTIGSTYRRLGLYDAAEQHLTRALELRRDLLGTSHPQTLETLNGLAGVLWFQGKLSALAPVAEELLAARRQVLGEDHPHTLESVGNLAMVYKDLGRLDDAEALYVDNLDACRRIFGAEDSRTLVAMNGLASFHHQLGRRARAERMYRETLEVQERVIGAEHPERLYTLDNLANLVHQAGRHAEAEDLFEEVIALRRRVLGPAHPQTLKSMDGLARLYTTQRRTPEAAALRRRIAEIKEGGDPRREDQ